MVCLKIRFCRDNRENRDSAHVNLNKLWARICWENTAYLRKFFPYNEAWWRTSRRIKLRRLSLICLVYTALPVPVCLYNCRERRLNLGRQGGAVRSVRIYILRSELLTLSKPTCHLLSDTHFETCATLLKFFQSLFNLLSIFLNDSLQ